MKRLSQLFRLAAGTESGKALIEFAVVAPLLIGIAFPSIDAVNFIRAGHFLNTVTREAGRAGFSCAYITSGINECLQTNINRSLPAIVGGIERDAAIVVSIWQYAGPAAISDPTLVARWNRGGLASRITAAQVELLNSYTPEKQRLMIVETRIPITSMTPFFSPERYLVMVM